MDGAIHWRGGPQIAAECRRIGGCPIGGAVMTSGGNLKARYVIHAVGPVYEGGDEGEAELLGGAYQNSLRLAADHPLTSIAFPSLAGAFCYPFPLAAPVALRAILEFLRYEEHDLRQVRIVPYPREEPLAYGYYAKRRQDSNL